MKFSEIKVAMKHMQNDRKAKLSFIIGNKNKQIQKLINIEQLLKV